MYTVAIANNNDTKDALIAIDPNGIAYAMRNNSQYIGNPGG